MLWLRKIIRYLIGAFGKISHDASFKKRSDAFVGSGEADKLCQELLLSEKFLKKKEVLDAESAAHYSATFRYGYSFEPDPDNVDVYWDTRNGLILKHDGKAIAILGFKARKDCLTVMQVQGVKNSKSQLVPLRWQQFLVAYLMRLGGKAGYREMRIIQASDSNYYSQIANVADPQSVTPREEELRKKRLQTNHDGTARSMGFKLDRRGKIWTHPL